MSFWGSRGGRHAEQEQPQDNDEFDQTPYYGGYDIHIVYGRALPPSDEICYSISSYDESSFDRSHYGYGSDAKPSYGGGYVGGEYGGVDSGYGGGAGRRHEDSYGGGDYGGGGKRHDESYAGGGGEYGFRVSSFISKTMDDEMPKQQRDGESDGDVSIRRLESTDKSKGFLKVLSQLSPCESISDSEFLTQFSLISSHGDDHVIAVAEDGKSGKIVATGSVFVERKFIHGCGKVGHIEDVVVDRGSQGRKLGQKVLNYLVEHAKKMGCYKVILDSVADARGFYAKCGFVEKDVEMAMYFFLS